MSEEGYRRRLSALLSADVEGYSLLMRDDEEATVRTVTTYRAAITNLVQQYRGRVVDSPGDNLLAEFTSVVDAVNGAVEIQREIAERNLELPENRRMRWRIGINLGDVFEDGERIYGDGVNVAARMEGLAEGGGICLSGTVFDAIEDKVGLEYEYLGEQTAKNIAKPIRAYRVLSYPGAAAHRVVKARKAVGKRWRKIAMAVAAVFIIGAVVAVFQYSFRSPTRKPVAVKVKALPLPAKPSIAVLPFANTSGDPKQDYLCDGFTDQIIYALSRMPGLFVIARNSSFSYKGKNVKVRQVGRELGVRYVVEGSVDRSGDKLRITAQLIDAQTGRHLWATRWDRKLKDIFALQDEITLKIMRSVLFKVQLKWQDTDRFIGKKTKNVEALLAYLKGMSYWVLFTREGNFHTRKYARKAIALDPKFPAAYSLLAGVYITDVVLGISKSPRQSFQQAVELNKKALAIDKHHPGANTGLALVYAYQRRYQKAIDLADRIIANNPNWGAAYGVKCQAYLFMGKDRESLKAIKKAMRLDPKGSGFSFMWLGHAYTRLRQYKKAIVAYKKALVLQPKNLWALVNLAICYIRTGRKGAAKRAIAEVLRIKPDFTLEFYSRIVRYLNKDPAVAKRGVKALRQAGLK